MPEAGTTDWWDRWRLLPPALFALALLTFALAAPSGHPWLTWALVLLGSLLVLLAFVHAPLLWGRPPNWLVGGVAYVLPVALALVVGGEPAAALLWPFWAYNGAFACPLGLPCPLGE